MRRLKPGRLAGFTLLEMLVVLVVLGFLMVGLSQGVRAGLSLWDAQTRRIGETAELDAAARVLRALLTNVAPPQSVGIPTAASTPAFKGTSESVSFTSDLPTGFGTIQRADITLELQENRLILSWIPHRHELSNAPAPRPNDTEILRGVDRIELAYWGSPAADGSGGWQTQWDGPTMPQLIRLRIVFAKADRRRFPDLIAAPQR